MSRANTAKESTHLIFAPNDDAGVCDSCLEYKLNRYRYHVNTTRIEKRCPSCIAKGTGASITILDEVAK